MPESCSSFSDCIIDPVAGNPRFTTLSTTLTFSVNLVMYLLYAILIVWVGVNLFKTIYVLFGTPSEEAFGKLREGLTGAALAVVGIILIVSARFIVVNLLRLVGIPDAENIFFNPFKPS